jgi:GDP-4-dehydro-6-deoxy-D-mannose reductase
VHRLIVCSTGAVYGAPGDASLPLAEDAPCRPVDAYGVSKLVAEHVSRIAAARHGIATVWARLFNLVGAGEDDRHVGPQLARQAAEIALGLRPPAVDLGDATATRDFIDVRDAARALKTLADAGAPGATYNVATGREAPVGSLLAAILDAAGLDTVEIRRHPVPAAVRRHVADTRRLRALGVVPRCSLTDGARAMVRYYADRVAAAAVLQPLG